MLTAVIYVVFTAAVVSKLKIKINYPHISVAGRTALSVVSIHLLVKSIEFLLIPQFFFTVFFYCD